MAHNIESMNNTFICKACGLTEFTSGCKYSLEQKRIDIEKEKVLMEKNKNFQCKVYV
jgi:hypothetical protein